MSEATPGTIVGGDFRILRPLQAGGMGAVHVAEQLSTGKQRALKLMHARLVDDPVQRQRFVREARVAAKIESEHVVEVLAAGVTETSAIPWLAMELLRGCDLSRLIRENGPLTLSQALPIMEQLCHGLGAAHDAGIVHRDLKPQNVFLCRLASSTRPWTVKVLDFGIAKVMADRSQTTAALGSPAWMAPEQTDTSSDMAPAADVWALALVLFWMLTGRFYWRAMNEESAGVQAVLREMLFEPIIAPSERAAALEGEVAFPEALDGWFLGCLQRDPVERVRDANEAWTQLKAATGDGPPASHVLPPEVAELASKAAVDLTPEVDLGRDPLAHPVKGAGETQASSPNAAEESQVGTTTASGEVHDDVPLGNDRPSTEHGPTLQSHELSLAHPDREHHQLGQTKWLLGAAFVVGAAGAVVLSQSPDAADEAAFPSTSDSVAADRSAPPSDRPPADTALDLEKTVGRAEAAVEASHLDEAERLASQVLGELGAVNGRRPPDTPPRATGERAQTVLARASLARARRSAPLKKGQSRPDVDKAARVREPYLAEAETNCSKAGTWIEEGGRCCHVHLAVAFADLEAAAQAAGLSAAPWTTKIDTALAAATPVPLSCRASFERVGDRNEPKIIPPAAAKPLAPFNPAAAQSKLNAQVGAAKSTCSNYLGQRVHSFTVTFQSRGGVSVSAPAHVDPAGRCIQSVLSQLRISPFAEGSAPQMLSVTVNLE